MAEIGATGRALEKFEERLRQQARQEIGRGQDQHESAASGGERRHGPVPGRGRPEQQRPARSEHQQPDECEPEPSGPQPGGLDQGRDFERAQLEATHGPLEADQELDGGGLGRWCEHGLEARPVAGRAGVECVLAAVGQESARRVPPLQVDPRRIHRPGATEAREPDLGPHPKTPRPFHEWQRPPQQHIGLAARCLEAEDAVDHLDPAAAALDGPTVERGRQVPGKTDIGSFPGRHREIGGRAGRSSGERGPEAERGVEG